MLSYEDFGEQFGIELKNEKFQTFFNENFQDRTDYTVFENYIVSEEKGVELGFKNETAISTRTTR